MPEIFLIWYGTRSEHIFGDETVLFKVLIVLFSCIAVDFILRSFLFTHIRIVILTNKKYFLHRALLHVSANLHHKVL